MSENMDPDNTTTSNVGDDFEFTVPEAPAADKGDTNCWYETSVSGDSVDLNQEFDTLSVTGSPATKKMDARNSDRGANSESEGGDGPRLSAEHFSSFARGLSAGNVGGNMDPPTESSEGNDRGAGVNRANDAGTETARMMTSSNWTTREETKETSGIAQEKQEGQGQTNRDSRRDKGPKGRVSTTSPGETS